MKPIFPSSLVLTVSLSVAAHGQETPAQRYQALREEYNAASGQFRKAETDEQRKAAVERFGELPEKFLDLADEHPTDPIAISALRQALQAILSVDSAAQNAWEMNRTHFPSGTKPELSHRAVALLLRDHIRSNQLGPVCDRLRYSARSEYEPFLKAIFESNEHNDVQGIAALAWAQLLNNQLQMLDLAADRTELEQRYDAVFGKGYLARLRKPGRDALVRRVEARFEEAAKFDDVDLPYGGKVAAKAKSELYALRKLSIGNPAPEIAGQDQDGKPMKLSDYRGKVVLLYFWVEF